MNIKRYGWVIGIQPDKVDEYKRLHAAVWPDVLKMIKACHIQNYSIYLRQFEQGKYYLFGYWEYCGADFTADMARMAADPATQKWSQVCEPLQIPQLNRKQGEWWSEMEEVFHLD